MVFWQNELHDTIYWLSLCYTHITRDNFCCNLQRNLNNNLAPIPFNEYFTLHQPKCSIRNSKMKLLVPKSKLEFAERSVLVRGSKTFNNLPEHVRLESSLQLKLNS